MRLYPIVTIGAALALASCGSDDSNDSTGTSAASTGAAAKPEVIDATLTEYKIAPSSTELQVGTYTFKATNKGKQVHIFEVEGQGVESETAEIQPGETADLTVELKKAGTYEFYCPVGNHKDQGMVTEFTVTG